MVFIVQWPSLVGSVSVARDSAEAALREAKKLVGAGVPHVRVHVPGGQVLKPDELHLLEERRNYASTVEEGSVGKDRLPPRIGQQVGVDAGAHHRPTGAFTFAENHSGAL